MRHKHGYRKLGRTSSHRKALLKNLSISLVKYEKIETTVFKAKELKSYFEKLVTKAKIGNPVTHRIIFASLQDKETTKKLVNEIAPRYKDRNGGYLKITKTRIRRGDATLMATLELI